MVLLRMIRYSIFCKTKIFKDMIWRLIKAAIWIAGIRTLWGNKLVRKAVKKRLSYSTRSMIPFMS